MTCEQFGCSLDIFTSCSNHCTKKLCLLHLIEHGDLYLRQFTTILNQLEQSTLKLIDESHLTATELLKRRQYEIERINRLYDEEQSQLRANISLAENAQKLIDQKEEQIQRSQCVIAQHDFEQLKIYAEEIHLCSRKESIKEEEPSQILPEKKSPDSSFRSQLRSFPCPLSRVNVFGIQEEHNVRCDCAGVVQPAFGITKHFEYYHRMLPECALRLRQALVEGQCPETTKLFLPNEIIRNENYFHDCPLTDEHNVFGAQTGGRTLAHFPCKRKQLTVPALFTHFTVYHKMKMDPARKLFAALKSGTLAPDDILFEADERIGTCGRKR